MAVKAGERWITPFAYVRRGSVITDEMKGQALKGKMTNEEIREENIQKTIDAGIRCFIENGIANTQIADVAARSGLSERSFLRYFGSKDNFVFTVLKSINVASYREGREYYQKITQTYATAPDRLRALMCAARDYFIARPEVFILLNEGQAYMINSPERESIIKQYTMLRDYWPSVVLSLFEQGIEEGSITCFSKEYIKSNESNALWYAYLGLIVQLAYSNAMGNYSISDCAETITRFMDQALNSLIS